MPPTIGQMTTSRGMKIDIAKHSCRHDDDDVDRTEDTDVYQVFRLQSLLYSFSIQNKRPFSQVAGG